MVTFETSYEQHSSRPIVRENELRFFVHIDLLKYRSTFASHARNLLASSYFNNAWRRLNCTINRLSIACATITVVSTTVAAGLVVACRSTQSAVNNDNYVASTCTTDFCCFDHPISLRLDVPLPRTFAILPSFFSQILTSKYPQSFHLTSTFHRRLLRVYYNLS